jgi:hypothetical protein
MTPEERTAKSVGGRMGAHLKWANVTDRAAALAPARRGFRARLARDADPDGQLSPAQLDAKVEQLFQAHMALMTLRSAQSRARRKARGSAAA